MQRNFRKTSEGFQQIMLKLFNNRTIKYKTTLAFLRKEPNLIYQFYKYDVIIMFISLS